MRKDCLFGVSGFVCLFVSGCFTYGPYGHPGAYPVVPHTAMVSQPMIGGQAPPGTIWTPASPTLATPNRAGELTAPQPTRSLNSEAADHLDESDGGKSVPDPIDPAKPSATEPQDAFGLDNEAKSPKRSTKTTQNRRRPLDDDQDIVRISNGSLDEAEPELANSNDEPSDRSSGLKTAEFQTQVRGNGVTPASAQRDIFGYDGEGYTWLKGIVEYDRAEKSWHLIYNKTPDENDPYGGEVTLKNPQLFKNILRSGQAVHVQGEFDETLQDRLGKPLYDVKQLGPEAAPKREPGRLIVD